MTKARRFPTPLRLFLLAALVVLLAATGAAANLQIVWGPLLGDLTSTSAQLAWYTNVPCIGYVDVAGQKAGVNERLTQTHKVVLEGLQPGTAYQYRIVVETAGATEQTSSPRATFHTPAAGLDTFTFCAYGDTRYNHDDPEAHARVVKAMLSCAPAFILHTGDLVNDGTSMDDWHHFFPIIAAFTATIPIYPVVGNHENEADEYYNFLPLPTGGGIQKWEWYSSIYGSCQIIALDSEQRWTEQQTWLRHLLAQPRPEGVQWRIVEFHRPPYTSGPHPPNAEALKYFCPLLEKPGAVDLVFNGHNHYYERDLKGTLNYVTVAGGGAPLYQKTMADPYRQVYKSVFSFAQVKVTPDSLDVTALDTDLQPIDHFTVTK
jgi:predicted phosphodiesterase